MLVVVDDNVVVAAGKGSGPAGGDSPERPSDCECEHVHLLCAIKVKRVTEDAYASRNFSPAGVVPAARFHWAHRRRTVIDPMFFCGFRNCFLEAMSTENTTVPVEQPVEQPAPAGEGMPCRAPGLDPA